MVVPLLIFALPLFFFLFQTKPFTFQERENKWWNIKNIFSYYYYLKKRNSSIGNFCSHNELDTWCCVELLSMLDWDMGSKFKVQYIFYKKKKKKNLEMILLVGFKYRRGMLNPLNNVREMDLRTHHLIKSRHPFTWEFYGFCCIIISPLLLFPLFLKCQLSELFGCLLFLYF